MWRLIWRVCAFLLLFSAEAAWAQVVKPPFVNAYEQVLDISFPRSSRISSHFIITVRYMPSFGREAQVTIRRTMKDEYEVELVRIPNSDASVWERYSLTRQKGGDIDPATFARQVRVERVQISLPKREIERLLERFSNIIIDFDHKKVAETLDGIQYELWLDTSEISLHWSTNVGGYRTAQTPPVARWADELLEACQRAAK